MPIVQMQIVRGGADSLDVRHAEDVDLRDNHEYLEDERRFRLSLEEGESVRTVGSGSPFWLRCPGVLA
jgi:hypothetical protein